MHLFNATATAPTTTTNNHSKQNPPSSSGVAAFAHQRECRSNLPSPIGRGVGGEGARPGRGVGGEGAQQAEQAATPTAPTERTATLGGCIAAGLSGPRRPYAGSVRDLVLGVRLLDGRGTDLRFGGQVMKNVAGYDVSRIMAGSLGTLALILEASVKTLPRVPAEKTLQLEMSEAAAIDVLNRWAGAGLCISATAWCRGELSVRLSGASAAVKAAIDAIGGRRMEDEPARRFWAGVRDQQHPFFQAGLPLWRLSLPQTTGPLALPGEQLIEWGGGLRWLRSAAEGLVLRETAARVGGHAMLFRGGERSGDVFEALSEPLRRIHRELKAVFDPASVFNPGRMYKDL
jgi:glycolate oxidase FAD binding subunit